MNKLLAAFAMLGLVACSTPSGDPDFPTTPTDNKTRLERSVRLAEAGFKLYAYEVGILRAEGVDVKLLSEKDQRRVRIACGSAFGIYTLYSAWKAEDPNASLKDDMAINAIQACFTLAEDLGINTPEQPPV